MIELCGARLVAGDSRRQQPMVTRALRRSGVGIDDRLHHSPRAEYRRWSKCQNVFRRPTLGFVGFGDERAARLKLVDVMVSPSLDLETISVCRRYGVAVMPGALTPTEVVQAWSAGADFVKVFPAGAVGGASYIKSLGADHIAGAAGNADPQIDHSAS